MSVTWETKEGRAVWSGRTLADWLDDLVAGVSDAADPKAVWVCGSVARGDDGADSDIDLLVVLDDADARSTADLHRLIRSTVSTPVP